MLTACEQSLLAQILRWMRRRPTRLNARTTGRTPSVPAAWKAARCSCTTSSSRCPLGEIANLRLAGVDDQRAGWDRSIEEPTANVRESVRGTTSQAVLLRSEILLRSSLALLRANCRRRTVSRKAGQLPVAPLSDHYSVAFDSDRLTQNVTHETLSPAEHISQGPDRPGVRRAMTQVAMKGLG